MKLILGIIGGFILALLGSIVITSAIALFSNLNCMIFSSISFLAFWIIGILVAYMSKSIVKAWRRLLLMNAFFSFLLPIAGIFYTSVSVLGVIENGGDNASIVGTAILGTVISCIMGVIGFTFGAFLLLIGLFGSSK